MFIVTLGCALNSVWGNFVTERKALQLYEWIVLDNL
jgi:hypothetical protein